MQSETSSLPWQTVYEMLLVAQKEQRMMFAVERLMVMLTENLL
jgi:hypothetical protein